MPERSRPSGAEALTMFDALSGTTKLVPFPTLFRG